MRAERLYYFLGVAGLTATFALAVIGGYGAMIGVPDAGLAGGVCSVSFLIPSLVFLYYSRQKTAVDPRLMDLADVLKGYRHISLDELAAKIQTTPEEAELLVAACLGRGYVQGQIDPESKTFTLDIEEEGGEDAEGRG